MPLLPLSAFAPDDDMPPPDGGDLPWCPDGEESSPRDGMLIWWLEAPTLSHVAAHARLPGTPLYSKLVVLPDDLQDEVETAGAGALGSRPRILGLHRARLKVLPVRDTSPLWEACHSCWGFVILAFYRAACTKIGGRFTTLHLEPVA